MKKGTQEELQGETQDNEFRGPEKRASLLNIQKTGNIAIVITLVAAAAYSLINTNFREIIHGGPNNLGVWNKLMDDGISKVERDYWQDVMFNRDMSEKPFPLCEGNAVVFRWSPAGHDDDLSDEEQKGKLFEFIKQWAQEANIKFEPNKVEIDPVIKTSAGNLLMGKYWIVPKYAVVD